MSEAEQYLRETLDDIEFEQTRIGELENDLTALQSRVIELEEEIERRRFNIQQLELSAADYRAELEAERADS